MESLNFRDFDSSNVFSVEVLSLEMTPVTRRAGTKTRHEDNEKRPRENYRAIKYQCRGY